MNYRPNPALDDAFGISPATWGREPDREAPKPLPPCGPPARNPAEKEPIRLPEGYLLVNGRIVKVHDPQDAQAFLRVLEMACPGNAGKPPGAAPTPAVGTDSPSGEKARPGANGNDAAPVVAATIPLPATVLEKPGEDLLFWRGQWFHRCQHCDPRETVLVLVKGHNPRKETRPLFAVPRGFAIRHVAGCPYAGKF